MTNQLTVCTVHYNTPRLTECAILSLKKHTPNCRVIVLDNSDRLPFDVPDDFQVDIKVIDNTDGRLINFDELLSHYPYREMFNKNKSNFGSAKHSASVDLLLDILPDGFILMDSDVLISRDISPLVDHSVAAVGTKQIKSGVPLIQPFLCWLNVPMLREKGIRYFNGEKMWCLSNCYPNNRYDTGAWLLEDIERHRLPWRQTDIWNYILHLGHGSWRDRNAERWLKQYEHLWK